ncbi:AAA family ATPase [Arthrobacter sp. zg-Y820]|uniref:AAA family ATPase n=1 Tax=unclassified Arthrobacter TaxID=235627 RepID=UPI001E657B5B|nr:MULTISPECIES: AAA family ATPase [unclassified Arthrobacter]MCC9196728.1 AAA family ATPase [Arthrobacter sp. zg-Y820]MDK1279590.1 AAA family ATPase [Arthrobacter sp. zg.Y820]WIB08038.1 AAA family ATPase [Arthrobacter sp. zg-Y820]
MDNGITGADSAVLFLGGRSGVGKTSAALELHSLLTALDVRHAVIEGDNLDLAHPAPWKHPVPWDRGLAAQNLAVMWQNYRALGYRRLIYTNTVSVRETAELAAAMGGSPSICAVLLCGSDETVQRRLAGRESGSALQEHLLRSREAAAALELHTPAWVHRIPTDGRTAADVAAEVLSRTGWAVPDPA